MPKITDSKLHKEITARFIKSLGIAAAERELLMDQVAEIVGISPSNLSRMKNPASGSGVTIALLHAAYLHFGISPTEIITGKTEKPDKVLESIDKRLAAIEKSIRK